MHDGEARLDYARLTHESSGLRKIRTRRDSSRDYQGEGIRSGHRCDQFRLDLMGAWKFHDRRVHPVQREDAARDPLGRRTCPRKRERHQRRSSPSTRESSPGYQARFQKAAMSRHLLRSNHAVRRNCYRRSVSHSASSPAATTHRPSRPTEPAEPGRKKSPRARSRKEVRHPEVASGDHARARLPHA